MFKKTSNFVKKISTVGSRIWLAFFSSLELNYIWIKNIALNLIYQP